MNEVAARPDIRSDPPAVKASMVEQRVPTSITASDGRVAAMRRSTVPEALPCNVGDRGFNRDYHIEVISNAARLSEHWQAWTELASDALEPNVFFEPELLLPAIKHLLADQDLAILLISATDRATPGKPAVWCGLFPFVRRHKFRGFPIRSLQLINHDYCFLRNPLVRGDDAARILDLFCRWIADESDAAVVELADQTADGPYGRLLIEALSRSGLASMVNAIKARALLVRKPDADLCIRESISAGKIKELRRQERRLADAGPLSYELIGEEGDIDRALEEFLALENSGWKGKQRTSIACLPDHRAFFESMARALFAQGRLRMLFLRLWGQRRRREVQPARG